MKTGNLMEMLWRAWIKDQGPRLVQVITITINGVPHMCFAPLIQEAFQEDGQVDISLIELGDAIDVQQAVEFMEGKYLQGRVVN